MRYKTGIERMIEYLESKLEASIDASIYCHIIGKGITNSNDFVFLLNNLIGNETLQVSRYNIDLSKGIEFIPINDGWYRTGENFSNQEEWFIKNTSSSNIVALPVHNESNAKEGNANA